ncbi:MAG TPA: hypothetical protein VE779_05370 [Candidatus Angelobacter sp.]|jgi:hypothetical protein|nr:hypothetical protein [Candidatus Angelobacter sp.]
MKKVLIFAALGETATGLILVAVPAIAIRALCGVEIAGAGIIPTRVAGIALIGLGVACWPNNSTHQQLYGMLTYSTLVMLYLIRIGVRGAPVGVLLWPAVALHAALCALLLWTWAKRPKNSLGNL